MSDDEIEELKSVLTENSEGFYIKWVAESINKRKAYSESRRENRSKKNAKHINNICKTYDEHMENENEIENTNGIDIKNKERKIFKIPIENEVDEFFLSMNSTKIEAGRFYSYYQSNGWKVGKNKMKDWKASARGWIMRTLTDQKNGKFQNGTSQHHLRNDSGVLDISAEHNRKGMERLGMIPKTAEA